MSDAGDLGHRGDLFVVPVAFFLILALAAGGSSTDPISQGLPRVVGVPVLGWGLWRMVQGRAGPGWGWPTALLAAAAGLVLVQLVPLPPFVWEVLPGRRLAAVGYAAARMATPWLPVSLTPWATEGAGLGLIPPAAMLCAALTLDSGGRRLLAWTVLGMAGLSVGLEMLQLAGGPESRWWIWGASGEREATGFFANRNHQGAFLAASLPLAAALIRTGQAADGGKALFRAAAGAAFALVAAVGAAATDSRAAVVLVPLGFLGAATVLLRRGPREGARATGWVPAAVLLLAMLAAAAIVAASGTSPLAQRVEEGSRGELRLTLGPAVARAGWTFAPVGSGIGSFGVVYQAFEPVETLGPAFINHAHDEYLETWMEAGVPGVALIAAFFVWWLAAARAALRRRDESAGLSVAGAALIAVFLVHSLVDYPLRTPGLASLFGLGCGILPYAARIAKRTAGPSKAR